MGVCTVTPAFLKLVFNLALRRREPPSLYLQEYPHDLYFEKEAWRPYLADSTTPISERPECGGPLFQTSAANSYSAINKSKSVFHAAHFALPILLGYSYFSVALPRDASGGESLPFAYRRSVTRIDCNRASPTNPLTLRPLCACLLRFLECIVSSRSPTGFSFDERSCEIVASRSSERPLLLSLSDE